MKLNLCRLGSIYQSGKKKLCAVLLGAAALLSAGKAPFFLSAQEQKLFTPTSDQTTAAFKTSIPTNETWNYLEKAKRAFDDENLSEAVALAHQAEDNNRAYYKRIESALKKVVSKKPYTRPDGKITDVYNALYENEQYVICKYFDTIFEQRSIKQLGNSMEALFAFLTKRAEVLPEASYIIGRVFQAQGEPSQAQAHFTAAWEYKDFLQEPSERFAILYSLADVCNLQGDYKSEEKFLLAVLSTDGLYTDKNKNASTMSAMIRTIKTNSATKKFFRLYRHGNGQTLQAYIRLAQLYAAEGRPDAALETSTAAVCIITTLLEQNIKVHNFLYAYNGLDDLMVRVTKYSELADFAQKEKFWDAYLQFADILYDLQLYSQAESVYSCVASAVPDFSTAQRAFYAIQKIQSLE